MTWVTNNRGDGRLFGGTGVLSNEYGIFATIRGVHGDGPENESREFVGSPTTIMSVYHDCSGDGGNIYWPIFGFKWDYGTMCGVFGDNDTSMTSPAPTIGSQN